MRGFVHGFEVGSTYSTEDDYEPGHDSEDDSELEEIELALYNQIHYQQSPEVDSLKNTSSKLQEPVVLVGPGGDNSHRKPGYNAAVEISVTALDSDSICDIKPAKRTNSHGPKQSENKVSRSRGVKRKRTASDCGENEDSLSDHDSSDDGFVAHITSDSDYSGDDDSVLSDLLLNLDQESITCEDDASSDQVDDQAWALLDEDRLPSSSSRSASSRYYKPGHVKPLNVRCRNCNEVGHLSKICPRPKKHLICYLCGETGHNFRRCPRSICYNCETATGHTAKECTAPRKRHYAVCHRCEMLGHQQIECPDLWRQYHATTEEGRPKKLALKRNPRVYCHNCGKKGHFGFECAQSRVNAHSSAAYPFIARYEEYRPRTTDSKRRRGKEYTIKEHRGSDTTAPARKRRKVDDSSMKQTTETWKQDKHLKGHRQDRGSSDKHRNTTRQNQRKNVQNMADSSVFDKNGKSKEAGERKKSKKRKKKKKQKGANRSHNKGDSNIIKTAVKSIVNVNSGKKSSKTKNSSHSRNTKSTVIQTERGFNIVLPNIKLKLPN